MIKIGVSGMGYVGKSVFAYYLAFGKRVLNLVGYDVNSKLIDQFNRTGLPEYFSDTQSAKSHSYSNNINDLIGVDYLFLCLPTPDDNGQADLSYINNFLDKYVQIYDGETIFVVKSTVPIGTCRKLSRKYKVRVVHCPEFLREGFEKQDCLNPDRSVLGFVNDLDDDKLKIKRDLFCNKEQNIQLVTSEESESIKYFSNAFLATKVTFANIIADFCRSYYLNHNVQIRAKDVIDLVSMDKRIGKGAFQAGVGFGGPCLPKDIVGLENQLDGFGKDILSVIIRSNKRLKKEIIEDIHYYINLNKKCKVVFIGKYFKTGVKDLRGSIPNDIFAAVKQNYPNCVQVSLEDGENLESLTIGETDLVVNFTDFSNFSNQLNKLMSKVPFYLADYGSFASGHVNYCKFEKL